MLKLMICLIVVSGIFGSWSIIEDDVESCCLFKPSCPEKFHDYAYAVVCLVETCLFDVVDACLKTP